MLINRSRLLLPIRIFWKTTIFPTTTTVPNTLSLHDALPICANSNEVPRGAGPAASKPDSEVRRSLQREPGSIQRRKIDRKSTRLNSSHSQISYADLCLKKKTGFQDYAPNAYSSSIGWSVFYQ